MCGIVLAVARKNIVSVLLEGLRKLEYRGYDSAGVAVLNGDGLVRVRSSCWKADLIRSLEHRRRYGILPYNCCLYVHSTCSIELS